MAATQYNASDISHLNDRLSNLSAQEIVSWAVTEFGASLAFASSFGAEDIVLLDILLKIAPLARVFVLDTGRLPQETYDVIQESGLHYGRSFEIFFPRTEDVQQLVGERGPNSFYESVEARKACCHVRKVEPLGRALAGARAWLTGLRREQAVTRANLPWAEVDEAHGGILKLNPLAAWSREEVWATIQAHRLPYNALHDRGFPSIGCAPCTRAIRPGEDIRAGRWWWENPEHKECGLHPTPRAAAGRGVEAKE